LYAINSICGSHHEASSSPKGSHPIAQGAALVVLHISGKLVGDFHEPALAEILAFATSFSWCFKAHSSSYQPALAGLLDFGFIPDRRSKG
jgi:hypothetical protein